MDPATAAATEEIVKGVVAQIKHQFSYLSQYHDNIENLSSKVERLKLKRQRVEERLEEARRNSQDEIEGDVNSWLKTVEVKMAEAEGILNDKDKVGNGCWKGWCLSLKLRHSLSRKAAKEAPKLDALLTEGDQFVRVAKPQLPLGVVQEGIASSSTGTHSGLESRLTILGHVMEAVKDDKIRIVRICGMGGVGKTTMAKEVEKMAREQGLFNEIARVEFNKEPDPKNIQLHIAELLGLHFEEESVNARAARLYKRLNDERQNGEGPNDGGEKKRILVILDNVWRREDLEEVGIPLGDEQRCKILLTSRQNDVCKNIAPEKEFKIEVLSDPEARILFLESLGNSHCFDQIAEELVKACAGLPISIKTIARAVANKKKVEWTVALRKLQKSALEGEYDAVFKCLKVSYDFLKNEEIRKFFRLCCLFRKGSEVSIEDLARYGIALRLFKDIDKLYEARDEAHRNVETLLSSNLLLSSDQKECVKVHDHVWDFAVSISYNGLFMVNYGDGLKEWPRKDSYEDYTSISLLCSEMNVVPEGLTCRNLELLQLTGEWYTALKFPEKFYEGMRRLNVLAFRSMKVPLIPKSLKLLTNLRILSLHQCSGCDVSMIGNLHKLEVLSFACSKIEELPTEIGNLKELRLLDLTSCYKLHIIAPGVLSSLISLEELYMSHTLSYHGDKVMFDEIASLSKLVVIDIGIPIEVLPRDSLFKKLEKFKISINIDEGSGEYLFPNSLALQCGSEVLLQDGIKFLIQYTERMHLQIKGLKTLLDNSETWDFSNLTSLSLVSCNELVYLINSVHKIEFPQLEELELRDLPLLTSLHPETETSASGHSHALSSHPSFNKMGPHPICRFPNLRSLKVKNCSRLRHLSTPSTFGELQHLEVQYCKSLQAIVAPEWREEEDSAIEGKLFPKLNHLCLIDLPNLSTIVPKGYTLRLSSLKKLIVENCGGESDLFANTNNIQKGTTDPEIALTSLEELKILKTNSTELWRNHFPCGFSYKLRAMEMHSCDTVLVLFSPHLIRGFHHLETLSVEYCGSLEVVFDLEELNVGGRDHKVAMLNKLHDIHLEGLGRMTHVWKKVPKNFKGGFHSLTILQVRSCNGLRYLLSPSISKCLVKLRKVDIRECEVMEEVVSKLDEEEGQQKAVDIVFFPPQLQELELYDLPSLVCIGPAAGACSAFDKLSLEAPNVGSTDKSCHKLPVLFPPHLVQGFPHLEALKIYNCDSLEVVFDLEELTVGGRHKIVMLNRLAEMRLDRLRRMTHVWKKVPKNFEGGFHNLTCLDVMNCDGLRYLISPSIAKCLVKLRKVDIRECKVMEEVISKRDEEEGQQKAVDIVFFPPQLQELKLYLLPSLVCIGPAAGACSAFDKLSLEAPNVGSTDKITMASLEDMAIREANSSMELWCDHFASGFSYGLRKMIVDECDKLLVLFPPHLGFPHLEELKIMRCHSLEVVFDLEELTAGGRHKIVMLNQLAEMGLDELPRITHIWKKVPKDFDGFHNLTDLYVSTCHGLRYLFSPLIAKCLVRLRKLFIGGCEKMEEVVSEIRGEEVEVQENSVDMINLFPELHELVLMNLPSLLICLGPAPAGANYDFEKQLSFGVLPNNVGTDDLGNARSSTSTRILNEKIAITSLEDIEIRGANSSMELWRDHFASGFSYGLRKMTVAKKCNKLLVLLPPHLVQGFPHLEELDIESCHSLEVVFDLEGLTVGGRHKIVMLNRLAEMTLSRLNSMTRVWKKVPKDFDGFHNLTSLYVTSCHSLRYLFSPLIAKCLVRLRVLSIEHCEKIEEVVSKRDEEDEVQENFVYMINLFPELHELVLKDLPSLLTCLGPAPAGANYNFDKQLSFGAPPNNVGTDHDQGNASSSTYTRILNEKSSNHPSPALVGMGRCQLPTWSLHNLTRLKVHGCNELLYLFPPHMVVRLPVLQSLSIESCESLIYLFCYSTATSLVQLRDLTIIKCEMMEVIVKDEDEVEEDRMGKLIVFSSLVSIVFKMLSNLKGFCLEVLCFEWPLLKSVEFELCWKMGVFTSGYSNTPILDGVFINSHKHSLEGDLNTTLMSLQQKDNLAFNEEGILTINRFLIAGDHLVAQCPTWSWDLKYNWQRRRYDPDLPKKKQFLITRNVPCLRSASSKIVVEEEKNEGDECGGDDKNIPSPRSYDVSITFDKPNKIPRLWLKGYDESKLTLPVELVLQDIAEHYPRELVTVEKHPRLYDREHHVSLYPHLQPNFMKDLYDHRALQGIQPNVENYLQILLEAYASVVPTIKYKCC